MLAASGLVSNPSISFIDLKLFSTANFILISLDKLRLSLLVSTVLFFIVTDLVIKLLEVVLECNDFVLGGACRIVQRHYVFITLCNHFALVTNAVFGRLDFILHALNRVLGGLVRVVLSLSSFSKLIDFVALTKLGLLSFSQLLVCHVELALLTGVACLTRLELICHLFQLSLFSVVIAACLTELLKQLHLVFLFDAVELAELVQLSDK